MFRFKSVLTLLLWVLVVERVFALPTNGEAIDDDITDEDEMHPKLPTTVSRSGRSPSEEVKQRYWLEKSKSFIHQVASSKPNENKAKNVIMFLGDGMGLATLAAARAYIGGEELKLSFENFPTTGLSRTYSLDKIVPDSACTATAYLCGVKGHYGTIGVNGKVKRDDCQAMADAKNHVSSIAKWAMDAGKAAGLVTTTRITHASPSGVYAHTADREWENDASLKTDCGSDSSLPDIAMQLIHGEVGKNLKVMLGGGRQNFQNSSIFPNGLRTDNHDLIQEFLDMDTGNRFVSTRQELLKIDPQATKRLLGTFSDSHLDYHLDAVANKKNTQPSLPEMTRKAIEMMENEEKGYFLFIEGGEIDLAHHNVWARKALDETAEFSKAIALARKLTNEKDTLIVVTSDHSHTFSLGGYQDRGSDIFSESPKKATDRLPYIPLSYANGKAFGKFFNTKTNKRTNPREVLKNSSNDEFPSTVPLDSETHGGEDVAVFASGPWNHLFSGVYEQSTIPHLMAFASCIGKGLTACN